MHLFNEVTAWDLEEFPLDDIDSLETFLHRCKNSGPISLFFDLENPTIEGLTAGFLLDTESVFITEECYNKVLHFLISGSKPEGYNKVPKENHSDNILGRWPVNHNSYDNPFDVNSVAERILEVRNKIKNQEYKITLKSDYSFTDTREAVATHTYILKLL